MILIEDVKFTKWRYRFLNKKSLRSICKFNSKINPCFKTNGKEKKEKKLLLLKNYFY